MSCEKCKELINYLSDYVDNVLEDDLYDCFEVHMKECTDCKQMVEEFLQTIRISKNLKSVDLPEELQESICANIKKCLKREER